MRLRKLNGLIFRFVSVGLMTMSFAQIAPAGMIGTEQLLAHETRTRTLERLDVLLASEKVAGQLAALGVDDAMIAERLEALSDAELITLQGRIDEYAAGGDVLGLVGAVFVVLLILEVLGVTNVFTSI